MTTFGLSSFLRIVNSSALRRQSLLRERVLKQKKPYDFHKEMRRICKAYLAGISTFQECMAQAKAITGKAERRSAIFALHKLFEWREDHRGTLFPVEERLFESPRGLFKIRFDPSFGYAVGGERIALHLWNTKTPKLDRKLTRASLSLFTDLYSDYGPLDLGVLSLRNLDLIRLADRSDVTVVGKNIVTAIEEAILEMGHGKSSRPSAGERPAPPA